MNNYKLGCITTCHSIIRNLISSKYEACDNFVVGIKTFYTIDGLRPHHSAKSKDFKKPFEVHYRKGLNILSLIENSAIETEDNILSLEKRLVYYQRTSTNTRPLILYNNLVAIAIAYKTRTCFITRHYLSNPRRRQLIVDLILTQTIH